MSLGYRHFPDSDACVLPSLGVQPLSVAMGLIGDSRYCDQCSRRKGLPSLHRWCQVMRYDALASGPSGNV